MRIISEFSSTFLDYPCPEDLATVVYFTGCEHNCPSCHNKHLQDEDYLDGTEAFDLEEVDYFASKLKLHCKRCKSNKVVLSGGDPLHKNNILFIKELLRKYGDKFDFCIYTGYDVQFVKGEGIKGFKFLKCGKMDDSKIQATDKTTAYMILASKNQVLYDSNYNEISENGIYYFRHY